MYKTMHKIHGHNLMVMHRELNPAYERLAIRLGHFLVKYMERNVELFTFIPESIGGIRIDAIAVSEQPDDLEHFYEYSRTDGAEIVLAAEDFMSTFDIPLEYDKKLGMFIDPHGEAKLRLLKVMNLSSALDKERMVQAQEQEDFQKKRSQTT